MKLKILKDISAYILIPVVLFNFIFLKNIEIVFQISCAVAITYSIFTKVKENRVNFTGLFIFFLIAICFLSNKNSDADTIYIYNTCIFLSLSLIGPLFRTINKGVSIIVTRDMLRLFNKNTIKGLKIIKKKPLCMEVNKIGCMIETNLIFISLVRIINILIYGDGKNSYLNFAGNCVAVVLGLITIYKLFKLVCEYRVISIDKNNKSVAKIDNTKGKIINLSSFK